MLYCGCLQKLSWHWIAKNSWRNREEEKAGRLVNRGDAGNTSTFTMDLLLIFKQIFEGDEPHSIAALVQPVVVETGDLNAEGASFFPGANALAGHSVCIHLAEHGAGRVRADDGKWLLRMDRGFRR